MLRLTHASLATVFDLFRYKDLNENLEEFPGYTTDQWGIKAHNRPWVGETGDFAYGQKILEVGGAYSLFPKFLAEKYDLEAWIGDDFGLATKETLWSRWGDPLELPKKYPAVNYVFERFGTFSKSFPDLYFDRIFTISTLEHLPYEHRMNVFKDMHRCLKPSGRQLHTIDIRIKGINQVLLNSLGDKISVLRKLVHRTNSEIALWMDLLIKSGVKVETQIPNSLELLDRKILVESPDVVYRFYPPNNSSKPYRPAASLLLVIDSDN